MLGARQRNPLVERMFSEYRARLGVEAVSVRSGLRPVVRALKRGRVVASLADQDGGRDGYFIDFFGRPASVQPGLFRLAARLGVPVVAGFALRTEDGWRGEIHPPWRPAPAEGEKAVEREARKLAVAFTRLVEEYVRRRPDHWFWVHRRWKTRPPGEAQTTPPRGR
jgi:KDO2-lipid IV(A) lauroyltransferase